MVLNLSNSENAVRFQARREINLYLILLDGPCRGRNFLGAFVDSKGNRGARKM
jgi:hypothetical protein